MTPEALAEISVDMLNTVVTIDEAAYLFSKNRKSIENRVNKSAVVWRRLGKRGYLITVGSLIKLYGFPVHTLEDYYANG